MAKAKKPGSKTAAKVSSRGKRPTAAKRKVPAAAKAAQAPVLLRPVPLYEFTTAGLAGHVRLTDPGRGITFSAGAEGKPLPAFSQEVLSLRHYLARADSGLLAPREESACEGKIDKQTVVFSYERPPSWPVTASARYQLLPEGGADASFAFSFAKPLWGFEAGIETLMPRYHPSVYVHSGGAWVRAVPGPQAQRFYPRNLRAAELIADGRWDALRLAGIALAVEPQGYDYPVVVVRDERTGWALVYMALTEECSSVWVNGAHRTIGLALVGADVKAQSTANCRLRVALCQAGRLDDALSHYRGFVQEARGRQ